MGLIVVTAPSSEPVSLLEACSHLRINPGDDDVQVALLIQSAREAVEVLTRRALMPTVFDATFDGFPYDPVTLASRGFALPRNPVTAVASVKYYAATTGTDTTMTSTDYYTSLAQPVARVWPAYGVAWPAIQVRPDGVRIRFTAGYASASAVPAAIKQAILILVADMWENREAQIVGTIATDNATVERLLWSYRIPEVA